MSVAKIVNEGVRNAFARRPALDEDTVEQALRRANRRLGRRLGRIEWAGSLDAYIRRSADLMVDGWTVDSAGPLTPPARMGWTTYHSQTRLQRLTSIERRLWRDERSAHGTARLPRSRRLPVYLNALDEPELASSAADDALAAAARAARKPQSRRRDFAAEKYWASSDPHWVQTRAAVALPFLTDVTRCFAAGLYGAALLRQGTASRTILIGRPRLRFRSGVLHAADVPAVVWPDGSETWYWAGLEVPARIAASRNDLTAEQVAGIDNQELRRVVLERLGWERFLETADAELRAQDDYGRLWATAILLDGQRVQLVEVVNATAEADGSYRRYFLRVPPAARTAREAVAWTFGFDRADDYILAAAS